MALEDDFPSDCVICQKHRGLFIVPGGAIYQDDLIYAGHAHTRENQKTAYLGYLMVETKRHAPGLGDLTQEESQAVAWQASRLARALMEVEGAEHIYAFVIGDGVPHFHMHVVPRYPGAPREYWGPRVDDWPEAPRGGREAIEAVCDRVRAALTGHTWRVVTQSRLGRHREPGQG